VVDQCGGEAVKPPVACLLAGLTFLTLTCKDSGVSPPGEVSGRVIFETEYVNWAWGYAYRGTVVFEDGSLFSYDAGNDSVAVLHHADNRYTRDELTAKYARHTVFIRTVASDTVRLMQELASEVVPGHFSDTLSMGVDAGTWKYSVYLFQSASARFEESVLQVEGDIAFQNSSQAATALASVMHRL
jgi:hypothetical protein